MKTDFKILAKLLAGRITPLLDELIHPCQTGFMANRNISHNIRKMIDIINFGEEDVEALIISLDFEKAFDKVKHKSIEGTLKYFNFGPKFIAWVMLLYVDFQAGTINSGQISNWFVLMRGLYQGNPLSSTIFILIVEIMGHLIRSNDKIKGICILDHEFKIIQFADDTNLFLIFKQETLD